MPVRIGGLPKRAGVSVSAVRYYEGQGLLPAAERTESGYRDYAEQDVERLRLIVAARELGFPIQEIRTIVAAFDSSDPCPEVAETVRRRIAKIEIELARLQTSRAHLAGRVKAWEAGLLSNAECLCAILQSDDLKEPQ